MDSSTSFSISKSICKIDGPIGRLDFFLKTLIYGICVVIAFTFRLVLVDMLGEFLSKPLAIVILLVFIWLVFVVTAKRLWDLLGDKRNGIIASVLVFVIGAIIQPVGLIADLICLFVKGKCIE